MTIPREGPPEELLPVFLRLRGRSVLVVGAGAVGTRRALDLASLGASVFVVAPRLSSEVRRAAEAGRLSVAERRFTASDVTRRFLVVAATDDPSAQSAVFDACEAAATFCLGVDDPRNASVFGAAVVRRGPVTFAVSTGGAAPALSRLLREVLESVFPDEAVIEKARALRADWKARSVPMEARFAELVAAVASRNSRASPGSE